MTLQEPGVSLDLIWAIRTVLTTPKALSFIFSCFTVMKCFMYTDEHIKQKIVF